MEKNIFTPENGGGGGGGGGGGTGAPPAPNRTGIGKLTLFTFIFGMENFVLKYFLLKRKQLVGKNFKVTNHAKNTLSQYPDGDYLTHSVVNFPPGRQRNPLEMI